jgi:hypothetical protein
MKHRRRTMLRRRRKPTSYRARAQRELRAREAFRRAIPALADSVMAKVQRRRANRLRKGKPDPLALDRNAKPFLRSILNLPRT